MPFFIEEMMGRILYYASNKNLPWLRNHKVDDSSLNGDCVQIKKSSSESYSKSTVSLLRLS